MVSPKLVELLRCLDDGSPLTLADPPLVANLNRAIDEHRVSNRGGQLLEKRVDGCLVRKDGKLGYPIIDGIPIMLANEAISLEAIAGSEATS